VDRRREFPDGKIETEAVFVLTSRGVARLDAAALAAALRAPCSIENARPHRPRPHLRRRPPPSRPRSAPVLASLCNLAITARHHLAPRRQRQRARTLPQMHRLLAATPRSAIAFLLKPWC
jgi:hypothetical protein